MRLVLHRLHRLMPRENVLSRCQDGRLRPEKGLARQLGDKVRAL